MDNRAVHLPGEHPAVGGEDLQPQGDGVGDVALFLFDHFLHADRSFAIPGYREYILLSRWPKRLED